MIGAIAEATERRREPERARRRPALAERAERLAMLEDAVEAIRELWQGDLVERRGTHFTIDRARLYTLPDEPPPLAVAASAEGAAKLAGGSATRSSPPRPARSS